MSKKLYEENDIKAIADAIRGKNGSADTYKLAAMAAAITAIETGGSLPDGIAMGEFKTTSATMRGGFQVEHGLGVMPNLVIIYLAMTSLATQFVHSAMVLCLNESYDEDSGVYYPEYAAQQVFYAKSTTIAQMQGAMEGDVDRTHFYVPSVTTACMYPPALTYKWIAVAAGG